MLWPTIPGDDDLSPSVLQLMAASDELARQGAYLLQAGAKLKASGYEPEGFQLPIVSDGVRTTVPLSILDRNGNRALVYTNGLEWSEERVQNLRFWIEAIRGPAQVHSSIPIIVVSEHDSEAVRALPSVGQFLVIPVSSKGEPAGPVESPRSELKAKGIAPDRFAKELASQAVAFLGRSGLSLDYSPESLKIVDSFLEEARSRPREEVAALVVAVGCYVGEVVCRHLGGQWRDIADTSMGKVASAPVVVELPGEMFCNPLGKVAKRLNQGEGDSVAFFFHMLKNRDKLPK